MKHIRFLFVLMLILSPLVVCSQDYDSGELDRELEEQIMEEAGIDSEHYAPSSEGLSALGEERQEDTFYSEGEESEWNLNGEPLPAEDYQ